MHDISTTSIWILDSYYSSDRSWLFTLPGTLRESIRVISALPSNIELPCTGLVSGELYIISNFVESMYKINMHCALEIINISPPFTSKVEKSHECATDIGNGYVWAANYGTLVKFDGTSWTEVSTRGAELHSTGIQIWEGFPLVIGGGLPEGGVVDTVEYFTYGDKNRWRTKSSLPKGFLSLIDSIKIVFLRS